MYSLEGKIFTCVRACKCKRVFLSIGNPLFITAQRAVHMRCRMQLQYMLLLTEYKYTHWRARTHTDTHTQTPRRSGDLMRPVETLLNCQSTLSLLTRSRQHQWLLFSNRGSLSNCIRRKEKSEVLWIWAEEGEDRTSWGNVLKEPNSLAVVLHTGETFASFNALWANTTCFF